MPTSKERNKAFDSLKLFAAFIVYTGHFWSQYGISEFRLYQESFLPLILKGLTGKLGVAVFGVLLGYFALSEGAKKRKSVAEYSIKRYVYFFISALIVNTLYCIVKHYPVYVAVVQSLFLGGEIFEPFWCIPSFMIASVLCFICGRANLTFRDVFIISILLVLCGLLWIGICVLGGILIWYLTDKPFFRKSGFQILLFLAAFALIRLEESSFTYFVYGLCAVIFVILANNVPWLNRFLSNPFTSSLGQRAISIYLIHELVYLIAGKKILDLTAAMGLGINFGKVISWVGCWVLICLLSYPLTAFIRFLMKKFSVLYEAIKKHPLLSR